METKIIRKNGVNQLCVNGEPIDNVAFKSFRPTANNVGDFYRAGVRLFHVFCSGLPSGLKMPYSLYGETWFGDGDYRFENFDRQMKLFLTAAPDAYVFINLHVDVRPWWLEQNPGNVNSFTHLSQIAGNEKWRRDTEDYIRAFIQYAEAHYGDRIVGYWLLGGHTTEWFSHADREESHPVKLAAFRRYLNDPDAEIPTLEERTKPKEEIFLDPVRDAHLITYRRFHAELIAQTVLDYCKAAKEALGYRKVVGVFFGYIMELQTGLWYFGHLDLDRVNESPYVDMIATPSSYRHRLYDDGTAYMILTDSLNLNEKMYFASFDNLTFLTPTALQNPRRLCNDPETEIAMEQLANAFHRNDLLNTCEKTIHGMRREMMSRLAKRCGTWWFDMLEGWYYDDRLMREVAALKAHSAELFTQPRHSAAEIAVFVGTEPLYYVNPSSEIHNETVVDQREALSQIGAPYDLYSLHDLCRVKKEQYKLWIFLNAYMLSTEQRDYINRTVKADGRTILFVGACDYMSPQDVSCARVSALAEMQIGILEKDEASIRAFQSQYGYPAARKPTLYIDDGNVQVLGRFADSRKCGLAVRKCTDYQIFFSALGHLSHTVLREIAKSAGVHIYAENGVFTYIDDTVLGVYNTGAEETTVFLREDGVYAELFSGKQYRTQDKKIVLPTGESPAQMLLLK